MIALDDRQRFDWLRLSRCEGVGPRTFQGLINRFGGAKAALEALPDLAAARGRKIRIPEPETISAEMEQARRLGARFIGYGESDYPQLLREIDAPPPLISVLGDVEMLHRPAVAIVGSRNASAVGRKMAMVLAHGLGEAGFVVVSGLARGIDTEAHRAALAGGTVAVLAGGLDKPYPPENVTLLDDIAQKGVVISEMPFGLAPRGKDFPRRNRLISGLAFGSIVVEAAMRSGSLVTARYASEQGREIFAVPGSPFDPRCEGTNGLLRSGATIVMGVEDVLNALRPMLGDGMRAPTLFRDRPAQDEAPDEWLNDAGENEPGVTWTGVTWNGGGEAAFDDTDESAQAETALSADQRLLSLLSISPVEIDTLMRMSGLPARAVQTHLTMLELSGHIERHSGNRVSRRL